MRCKSTIVLLITIELLIISIVPLTFTVDAEREAGYFVGSAKIKLTPKGNDLFGIGQTYTGYYLAGYTYFIPERPMRGVHDDIWARAIAITGADGAQNRKTVILVSLDYIGFFKMLMDPIRKEVSSLLKIDSKGIIIGSTHTHSSVDVLGLWSGPMFGAPKEYYDEIKSKIIKVIVDAYNNRVPAKIGVTQVYVPGVTVNVFGGHNESLLKNESVGIIQARDLSNKPIATVSIFGTHPEVLAGFNYDLSSDFPHYLREYIESNNGGTALFFVGPQGDQTVNICDDPDDATMQTAKCRTFDMARIIGEKLGGSIIKRLQNFNDFKTDGVLDYIMVTKKISISNENLQYAKTLITLRARVDGRSLPPGSTESSVTETDYAYIRIANTGIATVPGEPFVAIGEKIKSMIPEKNRFVLAVTNDMLGYIVPSATWNPDNYRESMSVGRHMEFVTTSTLESMINTLSVPSEISSKKPDIIPPEGIAVFVVVVLLVVLGSIMTIVRAIKGKW